MILCYSTVLKVFFVALMQILVLGMHRSGTSVVTRMVNMMGAYFGPEGRSLGYSRDNPKGFWERKDVVTLNDQLLHNFQARWQNVRQWDAAKLGAVPKSLAAQIRLLLLDIDAHRPWVIKDPRMCITLPCWLPFLEVPVAVIVSRGPGAIARSLEIHRQLPFPYGLALWEYYAVHTVQQAHALPKIFVSFESMLETPVSATKSLYDALARHGVQGLRLPSEREIRAFIEPSLERARAKSIKYQMTPEQENLAAMLRGELPFDPAVTVSPESQHIMTVTDARPYFQHQE
jgi:hypothetical protein